MEDEEKTSKVEELLGQVIEEIKRRNELAEAFRNIMKPEEKKIIKNLQNFGFSAGEVQSLIQIGRLEMLVEKEKKEREENEK